MACLTSIFATNGLARSTSTSHRKIIDMCSLCLRTSVHDLSGLYTVRFADFDKSLKKKWRRGQDSNLQALAGGGFQDRCITNYATPPDDWHSMIAYTSAWLNFAEVFPDKLLLVGDLTI